MKFDSVIVRDAESERRFTPDRLPLRIGTGIDCEIRLPGPGNAAVALLDDLDGEPFLQPVGRSGALKINGEDLSTSKRLAAGDELEFYGTRVVISEHEGAMLLQVRLESSAAAGRRIVTGRPGDSTGQYSSTRASGDFP